MNAPHLSDALAQAYVDDQLSEREAACCAEHAACCADCRLLVESYRALSADLDALPGIEPDLDFCGDVMCRIDDLERAAARERRFAFGLVGFAAAAAIGLFAVSGSAAWAPLLSTLSGALDGAIRGVQLGFDVAGPIASALRIQIVVACVALSLPLLFVLRQLVPSEAPAHS